MKRYPRIMVVDGQREMLELGNWGCRQSGEAQVATLQVKANESAWIRTL